MNTIYVQQLKIIVVIRTVSLLLFKFGKKTKRNCDFFKVIRAIGISDSLLDIVMLQFL